MAELCIGHETAAALVGSASAGAITSSVSVVDSGLRASLPSETEQRLHMPSRRRPAETHRLATTEGSVSGGIAAVHLAVLEHDDHPLAELAHEVQIMGGDHHRHADVTWKRLKRRMTSSDRSRVRDCRWAHRR